MSKIVLIQGSLRKISRTAIVVNKAAEIIRSRGMEAEVFDLRDYDIPFCHGGKLEEYGFETVSLFNRMKDADAYIISSPVYAYTYSGAVKNFIDVFGDIFDNKFVGLIYNAGGSNSYLASKEIINVLAFEYHAIAVQPTVYSHKKHFQDNQLDSDYVIEKLNTMIDSLVSFANLEEKQVYTTIKTQIEQNSLNLS